MSETIQGLVSIIMGIYNCAPTLPEAIDSILEQTYNNWELIMCDDASTDNTYEIAESYRNRFPDKVWMQMISLCLKDLKNRLIICKLIQKLI